MKKIFLTLKKYWKAETPKLARSMQYICGLIAASMAALTTFCGNLPDEFKQSVPSSIISHTVYIGSIAAIITVLLNFTKKNDNK